MKDTKCKEERKVDGIFVRCPWRVKRVLGVDVGYGDNLLKHKNVAKFIEENWELLTSNRAEDFREFFEKTGLIAAHLYIASMETKHPQSVYFDEAGSSESGSEKTFNHDIVVVSDVQEIEVTDEEILVDGEKVYKLEDDVYTQNEDLLELKEGGRLYRNGRLYDENVRGVWWADSDRSYLIYEDESVTQYTLEFALGMDLMHYKKVLFKDEVFLAMLDGQGRLCLRTRDADLQDVNTATSMYGVDDIEYDDETLSIIVGKEAVKMPLSECVSNPCVISDFNGRGERIFWKKGLERR